MIPIVGLPMRVIGLLESNVSPREIAAGVCLGVFLGFTPLNGPMAILLLIFFFVFRVNRVSTLITAPLFKAVYLMGFSGVLEKFGGYLLIDARALYGVWAFLSGLPVIAYLDLNNTLVAGGVVASAIISVPVYFIAKYLSMVLKNIYSEKIKRSKLVKSVPGLKGDTKTPAGNMLGNFIKRGLLGIQAPAKGWRKRIKLPGLIIVVVALIAIQYGVGLAVSPMAGSFILDTINRSTPAKVLADRVNIWPLTLSFSIRGLKVFDPEAPDKRIIMADSASFRLSPLAALSKRIVFSSIRLNGAEIDLEGRPDGSFNIQLLARPKGAAPEAAAKKAWGFAKDKTDWFGKFYGFIKNKFSKEAEAKRKAAALAKRGARTVTELPKGRSVRFRSGRGAYLFEIKDLNINGYVKIKSGGEAVEIDKARIGLGRLTIDPDNGTSIGLVSLKGDVRDADRPAGSLDIYFNQTDSAARFDVHLKDIDLNAVRFIYRDSLPVNIIKGKITLSSDSSVKGGTINSRTTLSMTGQEIAPKSPGQLAFGVIPVSTIAEAVNGIDPLRLAFDIKGAVEKPEFGGFRESLMGVVNPYIANMKDKLIKKGTEAIKGFLDKNLFNKQEETKAP